MLFFAEKGKVEILSISQVNAGVDSYQILLDESHTTAGKIVDVKLSCAQGNYFSFPQPYEWQWQN